MQGNVLNVRTCCQLYSIMHRHVRCEGHVEFQAVKILGNYTMHIGTFAQKSSPQKTVLTVNKWQFLGVMNKCNQSFVEDHYLLMKS